MATRIDVYSEDGGDFNQDQNNTISWYAKGIRILQARPITNRTSWSFLGAIHGINENLWDELGFADLQTIESVPVSDKETFWNQCQHGSWYFLPWHRGYLVSLERILREAIREAGHTDPENWALPYWNYSDEENPDAPDLPPAFRVEQMPDGTPNPLYVKQRYGYEKETLPLSEFDVSLEALEEPDFTGEDGGSSGFGGPVTEFSHSSNTYGQLESLPHNVVHVDVGQKIGEESEENLFGMMYDEDMAGLDPIFYLHHANIDRLWEVWLDRDSNHQNPTDLDWLDGPIPPERGFVMPTPDGGEWKFTPREVVSTVEQGYEYDDISDPLDGVSARAARLQRLGGSPSGSGNVMGKKRRTELVGANSSQITLVGRSASTQVQLDEYVMQNIRSRFSAFDASDPNADEPDRIYLNLENIRCDADGQVIDVYINLPSGADPDQHPELRARRIALFGAAKASDPNQPHGGMGVTEVINITRIVDALHLDGTLHTLCDLEVTLRPRSAVTQAENLTVERISVYRKG